VSISADLASKYIILPKPVCGNHRYLKVVSSVNPKIKWLMATLDTGGEVEKEELDLIQ